MESNYDSVIGYSPLEDVDEEKMLQVIKVNRKIIDAYYSVNPAELVLVAGAGKGQEAVLIRKEFGMITVGVDLNIENIRPSNMKDELFFQKQNIAHLAFPDDMFSLIYSYHVLEHVPDPVAVLRELYRVLKPGGTLFIGFPNKNRLFSYICASQKISFMERLMWNLNDYLHRFQGKFENKYGAHAGFTEREFQFISSTVFDLVYSVRNEYMLYKYSRYRRFISLLIESTLNEVLFPSNYYVCKKQLK